MFRTILWYTNFATSLIFKIPQMYKVEKLKKNNSTEDLRNYVHKATSSWAMSHIKMSGAKVNVFGLENIPKDETVLFVSNHQGNFDIALLMAYIDKPKGYIAKVEMEKIPLLSTWMRYMNCIFMDRSSLKKSASSIVEGIKILKSGHSLVIFPEGTRSKGGPLKEFKAGSFKLATKSKVPIIPITIKDSYKLMEQNNGHIKPSEVSLYIHEKISTTNLTKDELEALPSLVTDIIASKL